MSTVELDTELNDGNVDVHYNMMRFNTNYEVLKISRKIDKEGFMKYTFEFCDTDALNKFCEKYCRRQKDLKKLVTIYENKEIVDSCLKNHLVREKRTFN